MRSGQQDALSSHWTIALSEQGFLGALVFLLITHFFLALEIPPAEDELYYWTWSKNLSLSYFDHPPMVAWWIALATKLFGNSLFSIRLPACLTHFFLFLILGKHSSPKSVLYFLLLTPLSLFGALFMTPDIPLLLFWLLYVQWTVSVEQTLSAWGDDPVSRVYQPRPISSFTWIQGGFLLGLGLLSKYTMALAPLCLLFLLFKYQLRSWWRGFLLHGLISMLVFSPVLIFNFQTHFKPFLFQWTHIQQQVPFSFLYTFLGNQVLLLGALPFLLTPWIILNYTLLSRISSARVFTYFFFIPLAFFIYKATHRFLEANWALVAYISFWPLASYFLKVSSFRLGKGICLALAFVVPLSLSGLIAMHLIKPVSFISTSQDRLSKLASQLRLVKEFVDHPGVSKKTPLFLQNYQWTSYFLFLGFSSSYQLPDQGRPSHFSLNPVFPCEFDSVYYFHPVGEALPESLSCYKRTSAIFSAPLTVRNVTLSHWELIQLHKGDLSS